MVYYELPDIKIEDKHPPIISVISSEMLATL